MPTQPYASAVSLNFTLAEVIAKMTASAGAMPMPAKSSVPPSHQTSNETIVAASPTAPPPGRNFETAVPAVLTTSAFGMVRPGREARRVNAYEARKIMASTKHAAMAVPGTVRRTAMISLQVVSVTRGSTQPSSAATR